MRFRCMNGHCKEGKKNFSFENEEGKCPKCGTSINDPYLGGVIVKVAQIHFHLPSKVRGRGNQQRACGGSIKTPQSGSGILGTPNPLQVNCEKCREHPEFKRLYELFPKFVRDNRTEKYEEQLTKLAKGAKNGN